MGALQGVKHTAGKPPITKLSRKRQDPKTGPTQKHKEVAGRDQARESNARET